MKNRLTLPLILPISLCALVVFAVLVPVAEAGLYSFSDESGRVHFSSVQLDSRYVLVGRMGRSVAKSVASIKIGAKQSGAQQYSAHIADAARDYEIAPALLHAVIATESGYNAAAVSPKGAVGLMQLMPETAKHYAVTDRHDPVQNIRGGAQYLRDLLNRFNQDMPLTLAAYNAGEKAVMQYGGKVPPFAETQAYVPKVMGYYHDYLR
jgi:soluble lytic murein transglycosylase-like protein